MTPQAYSAVNVRVTGALETLFSTSRIAGTQFYAAPAGVQISDVVLGPDDAAYAIVGDGVVRVDPVSGAATTIMQVGAGGGQGMGRPRLLAAGGLDLLIVDDAGQAVALASVRHVRGDQGLGRRRRGVRTSSILRRS